jgi:hypothetical protein
MSGKTEQKQMTDIDDRGRDLAAFANASAQPHQPLPGGHALARPTSGLADRVIGAQPVAVYRDEARIRQQLIALAAYAGDDWFYRFPVSKKGGGQDWIEGPSIKLANNVARIFGNCSSEIRELDVGDAWIFYARFSDLETGFSYERAYRQRKSQATVKTKDADRQLDIAYQIGQSKAIRNCIVNALQIYADFAFEQARNSLVDKIGIDLPAWRSRTIAGLNKIPVELNRVERVVGRSAKDWMAPDVAQIIAMMKSIADGMALADEVFPPREAAATTGPAAATADPSAAGARQEQGSESGEPNQRASRVPAAADEIKTAYERGKQARAAGVNRKALPGEYRDEQHTRAAVAWAAGFDGAELPMWKD